HRALDQRVDVVLEPRIGRAQRAIVRVVAQIRHDVRELGERTVRQIRRELRERYVVARLHRIVRHVREQREDVVLPGVDPGIAAEPAVTPLTSPLPFTVATAVLLLAHVTTRPVSGLPLASFGVAASCAVCPTCTLAGDGLTVTEATGTCTTVMADVPLCPSLV